MTIRTWVQLTFGGNGVVFHAETIGNDSHQWECEQEECDACHIYWAREVIEDDDSDWSRNQLSKEDNE